MCLRALNFIGRALPCFVHNLSKGPTAVEDDLGLTNRADGALYRALALTMRDKPMNKADLIAEVATKTGQSKTQVAEAVDAAFDIMADALKRQDEVRIPNFGVFAVVATAARKARNPQTGAEVPVPPSLRARFRPGKALKDALEAMNPAQKPVVKKA
jgi:DNA-binding protein HU-beta